MARLYTAGAEIDGGASTATQNVGVDGQGISTVTRDTSTFRSGVASWKCDSTGSNLASRVTAPASQFVFFDGRTYWFRAYVFTAATPSAASTILRLSSGGNGPACRFRTDGTIELMTANAVQGSPSAGVINDSAWHRIELKGVGTATGTWTASELLLDGVSIATWSGSTSRLDGASWGWGTLSSDPPGASKVIYIDDIALNDSTGASNNDYPGSGKVVLLKPVSDSAVGTGWTLGTGTAISANSGSTAIKNTPPLGVADLAAGSDVKQIRNATNNANVNFDATMTTYTAAGVGAGDTVNAVVPVVATAAPVTTSAKQGTFGLVSNPAITNVALDITGTSGAFWAGATAGTYGAGWKWSIGTAQNVPSVTLGTGPVARITQVTGSTRIAIVCAMFIYVDYTPHPTSSVHQPPFVRNGFLRR